jgi:hypothetical protein
LIGIGGSLERAMMNGAFRQSQAAFAPDVAGQLVDKMFLGRPLRGMLRSERLDQRAIFGTVFPWQDRVLR